MKQQDHYREILRLVHAIGRQVNPQHLPALRRRHLSLSQLLVLDALSLAERPLRMTMLADESGLQATELTRVMASLEERGWLERSVDAEDGRAKQARLTTAGRRQVREAHAQATAELSAVWDDFTHEEWHRFIDYLQRFERGVRRARAAHPRSRQTTRTRQTRRAGS